MRSFESSDQGEAVVLALPEPEKYPYEGSLKLGLPAPKMESYFAEHYPHLAGPVKYAQFVAAVMTWAQMHYSSLHWGTDYSVEVVSGISGAGPFLRFVFDDSLQKQPELVEFPWE